MSNTTQPIFATGGSLSAGQSLPMIGRQDSGNNYATGIEAWYMSPGGLFVPVSPVQAATNGLVSPSQQTINTTATAIIIPSNIKQLRITNLDATNTLYLGPTNSVTPTGGYAVLAKGEFKMDVVPGSTITLYGISTASIQIAITGVA